VIKILTKRSKTFCICWRLQ